MSLLQTSTPANSTSAVYGAKNNTNGTNCSQHDSEDWINNAVSVYLLLITVLGIVFNVFVLMVFCLHKKPCTVAEIYLSNLAAADLVLVSCLPFWAVTTFKHFNWIFGRVMCKVVLMCIRMNALCSIYFLVLVSIDRYLALVHTMTQTRMRRPKFAKLACVLVWVMSLLLGISTLIYRDVESQCNSTLCYLNITTPFEYLLYEGKLLLFSFIIPIPIISFCTVKIIQALSNRLMERSNGQKIEHKATNLVLVVLLAFLICWVPFHLYRIVEVIIRARDLSVKNTTYNALNLWSQISNNLAFFNSVLNPILYVVVGKNFRKKVKEVFQQRNSTGSITTSLRSNLTRSSKSADAGL